MFKDFGKESDAGKAALAAFGSSVASLELDGELDIDEDLPSKQAAPDLELDHGDAEFELEPDAPALGSAIPEHQDPDAETRRDLDLELDADADAPRPNLEPVSEDAHPPQNRRVATGQHALLALALDENENGAAAGTPDGSTETPNAPGAQGTRPSPPSTAAPVATSFARSPSPAPTGPPGLLSSDRLTNILGGVAIGLMLTIIPAKKLAASYEIKQVQPLLAELEGSIAHPLGVEAGLMEAPESIAAKIRTGREDVRRRYLGIWLLAGLPIGLGLGFAPRPW